jgi:hypothetical protein
MFWAYKQIFCDVSSHVKKTSEAMLAGRPRCIGAAIGALAVRVRVFVGPSFLQ